MSTENSQDFEGVGAFSPNFDIPYSRIENEPSHPLEWAPPPKLEYGYRPQALLDSVFVKPCAKEHKSRLITPDAYGTATDQGFVTAVGPKVEGIKAGDLVLYDRFAKVGYEFDLLDEDGEISQIVRLSAQFIFAVLERVRL